MPTIAFIAMLWNSDCAPLPIMAMVVAPLGASTRATSAEVAAVRIAVSMVISDSNTG